MIEQRELCLFAWIACKSFLVLLLQDSFTFSEVFSFPPRKKIQKRYVFDVLLTIVEYKTLYRLANTHKTSLFKAMMKNTLWKKGKKHIHYRSDLWKWVRIQVYNITAVGCRREFTRYVRSELGSMWYAVINQSWRYKGDLTLRASKVFKLWS